MAAPYCHEGLALIPARGGSKGIPRKNIKLFCGKPLIAWTIEEAKKSKHITRIIVSTDDEEIAGIARRYGAEVLRRPSEISGDSTPDLPVFEHAIRTLEADNYLPEFVVHLRATGPLRVALDINRGIELLLENPQADSVRAVMKAPLHPLKTYALGEGGVLGPFVPAGVFSIEEPFNLPWQNLPRAYTTGGYLSVIRPATILAGSMSGSTMLGFEVDPAHVVDIDTQAQFLLAEMLMRERLSETLEPGGASRSF